MPNGRARTRPARTVHQLTHDHTPRQPTMDDMPDTTSLAEAVRAALATVIDRRSAARSPSSAWSGRSDVEDATAVVGLDLTTAGCRSRTL